VGNTVTFEKITPEVAWQDFDSAARRILKMSGDELIRRWDSGELRDQTTPDLMRVLMLRPSGR
jgi:hypothetical protein